MNNQTLSMFERSSSRGRRRLRPGNRKGDNLFEFEEKEEKKGYGEMGSFKFGGRGT